MSGADAHLEVAARLTDRIVAGDLEGVRALYHEDGVVWRNTDQRELTVKQMLKVIAFLANDVTELRYDALHVQETPTGFVQQHVLCGRSKSGNEVQLPACLVATVEDGRIRRLDEYMDSAALAPLLS